MRLEGGDWRWVLDTGAGGTGLKKENEGRSRYRRLEEEAEARVRGGSWAVGFGFEVGVVERNCRLERELGTGDKGRS